MGHKKSKVQTGFRVPEELYEKIAEEASRFGMSINSYMLFLINLGQRVVLQSVELTARDLARSFQSKTE